MSLPHHIFFSFSCVAHNSRPSRSRLLENPPHLCAPQHHASPLPYSVRTPPSHPDTNSTAKIPYTHITATNPSLHFVSRARVFMYLSTIKSSHYNHLCTIVSVKNFDRYTKCFKMRGFYFTRCAPCASFVLAPPLAASKNHIISTESVLHRHRNHHPAQKRLGD